MHFIDDIQFLLTMLFLWSKVNFLQNNWKCDPRYIMNKMDNRRIPENARQLVSQFRNFPNPLSANNHVLFVCWIVQLKQFSVSTFAFRPQKIGRYVLQELSQCRFVSWREAAQHSVALYLQYVLPSDWISRTVYTTRLSVSGDQRSQALTSSPVSLLSLSEGRSTLRF